MPIGSLFLTSQLITKLQKLSVIQSEIDKFLFFHSNPLELSEQHVSDLEQLIQKYPYSQTLKALLAKASENTSQFTFNLGVAAAFTSSRENLHHFIQHPEAFVTQIIPNKEGIITEETEEENFGQAFGVDLNEMMVTNKQVAVTEDLSTYKDIGEEEVQSFADVEEEFVEVEIEKVEEPISVIEETKEEVQAFADVEEELVEAEIISIEEPISIVEEAKEEIQAFADVEEELVEEEITAIEEPISIVEEAKEEEVQTFSDFKEELIVEEITTVEKPISIIDETKEEVQAFADFKEELLVEKITTVEKPISIIDEAKEEIQSFANVEEELVEAEITAIENPISIVEETKEEGDLAVTDVEDEQFESSQKNVEFISPKQDIIFESPVHTDFFALNKKETLTGEANTLELVNKDQDVTPYHDDSMPYTFLWWLNKTRKEHASNLRPFAANNPNKKKESVTNPIQDSLNSQIAANIFHLKGVEEIALDTKTNVTVPFNFQNKETVIIEKFIKEEPSIKPPAANKIDTENKAKKSSEDANDVVSETLAKIYVEQMLYHKALDVYKKLSLKFPEKSAYFASQIKYLELKVN